MAQTDQPGAPLAHFREHRGAGVRMTCHDCQFHCDLPLQAIIERLEARGVGGATTGIVELSRLVRTPCSRCGGREFVMAPARA
jgi:hypothetical protein